MFSKRAAWNAGVNRLTLTRHELAREGREILDLTISNPTKAGIEYPHDELAEVMSRAARAAYDPEPLGLSSAREAVAQMIRCDAADIVLTASTSEAYSHLFKLLTDPGDDVVTATPSYPLLEHLASLELVSLKTFALEFHRRWEIAIDRVRDAISDRTRSIIVVNPNNPTGSYVTKEEQSELTSLRLPVISDEVFFDYQVTSREQHTFVSDDVLTFTLGGLSKSAGLPHYKLGWIRVSGAGKREAIDALELIADNYLSVATPVQQALPDLLRIGATIRAAIHERVRRNLDALTVSGPVTLLPVEGGWSAVLRVPRTHSDEDLAIDLLRRESVGVHPGYFFDFETDGFLVVSLLTPPQVFDEGIRRILRSLPT